MTPNQPGGAPIIRITEAVVMDGDEVVLRLRGTQVLIRNPGGKTEQRRSYENILLADNTSFNAAMLAAQPPVVLCCCRLCRHPAYSFPWREKPNHGLIRLDRAKNCAGGCGALCCAKHRVHCSDRKYRCTRCSRKWRLAQGLLRFLCSKG